jgi:hypothetical protein
MLFLGKEMFRFINSDEKSFKKNFPFYVIQQYQIE